MKSRVLLIIGFCLLLSLSQVEAMGVVQDYLEDNTLKLMNGRSHTMNLYLQNPDDFPLLVNLSLVSEIAEIIDPQLTYNLSPKTFDTQIAIKITAPDDAKVGDLFTVRYSFYPLTEQKGGQIGMVSKITRTIDVLIVGENGVGVEEESALSDLLFVTILPILSYVLLTLVLIVIFAVFIKRGQIISKKVDLLSAKKKTKKSPSTKKDFDALSKKIKNTQSEKEIKELLKNEWKKKK